MARNLVEREAAEAAAAGARRSRIDYKWVATGVVVVGAMMSILNQTVVNVALPVLETEFRVPLTEIQWVVTAYALGLAAVIPLSGWLCERYGTKRVFTISQLLFASASILCGLAWSNSSLIGFRVVQGLAGGLVMPVGMTILMRISKPHERGRMMAALGLPMMVAPTIGPTIGGWLVQYVSWRWMFFFTVPFGVLGAILSSFFLRRDRGNGRSEPLDVAGLALATPAVLGIVYGLSQPSVYGWLSPQTLLPIAAGLVLLAVFAAVELRLPAPLIEMRVFRDPAFGASMALNFLIGLSLFGSVLLVPLFLQQVQGYGAFDAGIVLGGQGLGAALTAPIGGILTDRFGARKVVPVGLAFLTGASVWMATLTPDTSRLVIALMLVTRGAGMGLSMMPSSAAAYITLPHALISRATAVANVIMRVASGFGVAILATVLSLRIKAHLPDLPAAVGAGTGGSLASAHLPPALKAMLLAEATKGFQDTFWVAATLTLACFPMALLLRRPPRVQS